METPHFHLNGLQLIALIVSIQPDIITAYFFGSSTKQHMFKKRKRNEKAVMISNHPFSTHLDPRKSIASFFPLSREHIQYVQSGLALVPLMCLSTLRYFGDHIKAVPHKKASLIMDVSCALM